MIVNTASIAGKAGQPWLSIYGATKAAVVNYSVATEREVGGEGIACTALAPAFVDTAMTDFVKGAVPAEEMIRPSDIGEAVRYLVKDLPQLSHPGDRLHAPRRGHRRAVAPCGSWSPPSATRATSTRRSRWDGRWRAAATR